jgi:hypothetical protein
MGIRDRLRRLEKMLSGDRGPTPEEVQVAWGRVTERARVRLHGETVDEGQRARDRAVIERWAEAEGVSLEIEAEQARAKLRGVDGR